VIIDHENCFEWKGSVELIRKAKDKINWLVKKTRLPNQQSERWNVNLMTAITKVHSQSPRNRLLRKMRKGGFASNFSPIK